MKKYLLLSLAFFLAFSVSVASADTAAVSLNINKTVAPAELTIGEEVLITIDIAYADSEDARAPLDVVLALDHSYSMFEGGEERMRAAKAASINFIGKLNSLYDQISLIRFSESAETQKDLHSSSDAIVGTIEGYHLDSFSSYTDISAALFLANEELRSSRVRPDTEKVIVLLSDGGINRPLKEGHVDIAYTHEETLRIARQLADEGVRIYTIALGGDADDIRLLEQIAEISGGAYFDPAVLDDLSSVYNELAGILIDGDVYEVNITEILPPEFSFVSGSESRTPSAIRTRNDGARELVWHISELRLGEEQFISYKAVSRLAGEHIAMNANGSVVHAVDSEGGSHELHYTPLALRVASLGAPTPVPELPYETQVHGISAGGVTAQDGITIIERAPLLSSEQAPQTPPYHILTGIFMGGIFGFLFVVLAVLVFYLVRKIAANEAIQGK